MIASPRIYYHALLWGDQWKTLVQHHMLKLHTSNLLDAMESMTIGVAAFNDDDFRWMRDLWSDFRKVSIIRHDQSVINREERATLLLMKEWCDSHNTDSPILYFHTKGLTRSGYNIDLWRMFMEHHNIDKWRLAASLLSKEWVTYGVNLRNDTRQLFGDDYYHYSGNFWWARSSYIKKLKKDFLLGSNRWEGEFWIGTGGVPQSMYNYMDSGVDHYDNEYTLKNYIKPTEIF